MWHFGVVVGRPRSRWLHHLLLALCVTVAHSLGGHDAMIEDDGIAGSDPIQLNSSWTTATDATTASNFVIGNDIWKRRKKTIVVVESPPVVSAGWNSKGDNANDEWAAGVSAGGSAVPTSLSPNNKMSTTSAGDHKKKYGDNQEEPEEQQQPRKRRWRPELHKRGTSPSISVVLREYRMKGKGSRRELMG